MRTIGEVMRTELVEVFPHQTLREVHTLLIERAISGAPVVEKDGVLIGVISQTTMNNHLTRLQGKATDLVDDVMTPYAFSVRPHDKLEEILEIMVRNRIHRVVVTDASMRPVGIVTSLDLVEEFYNDLISSPS